MCRLLHSVLIRPTSLRFAIVDYVLRLQRSSYPAISEFRYIKHTFYNYVCNPNSCMFIQRRYITNILRVMPLVEINCTRNEIILFLAHFAFHNTETSFTKTLFIVKWHSRCGISLNFKCLNNHIKRNVSEFCTITFNFKRPNLWDKLLFNMF